MVEWWWWSGDGGVVIVVVDGGSGNVHGSPGYDVIRVTLTK